MHYLGADSQSVEGKKRDGGVGGAAAVLSIFYVLINRMCNHGVWLASEEIIKKYISSWNKYPMTTDGRKYHVGEVG